MDKGCGRRTRKMTATRRRSSKGRREGLRLKSLEDESIAEDRGDGEWGR